MTPPYVAKVDGAWCLALCGSRHLSSTEAGFSPVEGDSLAVVWCLRTVRLFLLRCPNLILVTDHKPVVKLFGDKVLSYILNPMLLAMKEKNFNLQLQCEISLWQEEPS